MVRTAAVGFHPDGEAGGLAAVGVLLAAFNDQFQRVALVNVGVVGAVLAEVELQLLSGVVVVHVHHRGGVMVLTVKLQEIVRGGQDGHRHAVQVQVSTVVGDCQIKGLAGAPCPELDLGGQHRGRIPIVAPQEIAGVRDFDIDGQGLGGVPSGPGEGVGDGLALGDRRLVTTPRHVDDRDAVVGGGVKNCDACRIGASHLVA